MESIIKEQRFCAHCGKEIFGREGKLFCSNYCRNTHNNKANKDITNLMRNTNNTLRKNYKILLELNPGETANTTRKVLVKAKFDFDVYTSVLNCKTGNVYYFVYDRGYFSPSENNFVLMNKEF
jgi:predicted nucleic acid-binding Zn ribbon protein